MNVASVIILAIVAALVALALYFAFRKGGSACSCGDCAQKGSCPHCGGECHCKD